MDNFRTNTAYILGFIWTGVVLFFGGKILMNVWNASTWKQLLYYVFDGGLGTIMFVFVIISGGWSLIFYMFNQEDHL